MRVWLLLVAICFCGLFNTVGAQGYLKITMTAPSDSGATDGSVTYEMVGVTQTVHYQTYLLSNDSMVGTGSTINNLGTGIYLVLGAVGTHSITPHLLAGQSDQAMGACFSTNDIVGEFTLGGVFIDSLDTASVIAPAFVNNPTSPDSCNGSIIFNSVFHVAFLEISPVPSDTNINYATWSLVGVIQDTINNMPYDSTVNLCTGRNAIAMIDLATGTPVAGFTFFTGSEFSAFPGFSCIATSTPVSDTGQCNGSITMQVFGGTAPYTYFVDSVPQSQPLFANECQGLHQYFVTDFLGVPTSPQNVVVGNLQSSYVVPDTFANQPIVDTVTYNLQNCNYNYNLTPDSLNLDSVIAFAPPQRYIVLFDVWQQGQHIYVTDTIALDSIGVNQVNVIMYCDTTHRAVEGTLTITCYIDNGTYHPQPTSISAVSAGNTQFEIFPNPAGDISTVHVQLTGAKKFDLTLTDLSGQVLQQMSNLTNNQLQLNLKNLAAGVYVVTMRSNDAVVSKQLVKF